MTHRPIGFLGVAALAVILHAPALADETIEARDNGEIQCSASRSELTRISLVEDQFVAVTRIETGNPSQDITIIHEPTRGDLYVSVPEGYAKSGLTFFGTTRAGFVYKFNCEVAPVASHQVFVRNSELLQDGAAIAANGLGEDLEQSSVELVRAMFEQRQLVGYAVSDVPRAPVNIGALKVQLTSEYTGPILAGHVLRIENTGDAPLTLTDELIGGRGALAVSVNNRSLEPGQATAAFIVLPSGGVS